MTVDRMLHLIAGSFAQRWCLLCLSARTFYISPRLWDLIWL